MAELRRRARALPAPCGIDGAERSASVFGELADLMLALGSAGLLTAAEAAQCQVDIERRAPYRAAFRLDNRTFGERWAQSNLRRVAPSLRHAKQSSFDLALDVGVRRRIEVKAARVVRPDESSDAIALVDRGCRHGAWPEWAVHFSHVKPEEFDVLVLMAAWLDAVDYWVIPAAFCTRDGLAGFTPRQVRNAEGNGQLHISAKKADRVARFVVSEKTLDTEIAAAAHGSCPVGLTTGPLQPDLFPV